MKRLFAAVAVLFMLCGLTVSAANAVPVTFNFSGVVHTLQEGPDFGVSIGDTITGSYTFESTTPDGSPSASSGSYAFALLGATFSVGPYSGTLDPAGLNAIQTLNDVPFLGSPNADEYLVSMLSLSGPTINGFQPLQLDLGVRDLTGTGFGSDALPLTPPDLSLFSEGVSGPLGTSPARQIVFGVSTNGGAPYGGAIGNLTSLTLAPVAAVPEPSTLLLLGAGVAGLITLRKK